jgi:hypothetical protein
LRGTGGPKALDDKDKNILLEYVEEIPKYQAENYARNSRKKLEKLSAIKQL